VSSSPSPSPLLFSASACVLSLAPSALRASSEDSESSEASSSLPLAVISPRSNIVAGSSSSPSSREAVFDAWILASCSPICTKVSGRAKKEGLPTATANPTTRSEAASVCNAIIAATISDQQ